MLKVQLNWQSLTFKVLLVTSLIVLVAITGAADGLRTKTTSSCHNETTIIVVNETKEEWCAVFSSVYCLAWGNCYCNVTREVEKTHVTEVCEELTLVDGDKLKEQKRNTNDLSDPEVAAIAVICSLIFSILLSLTVFCVQRRCSVCLVMANTPTQVVAVERGDGDAMEGDKFLPAQEDGRYITVQAANKPVKLYEDVGYEAVSCSGSNRVDDIDLSVRKKPLFTASDQSDFPPDTADQTGYRKLSRTDEPVTGDSPVERKVRISDQHPVIKHNEEKRYSKESYTQTPAEDSKLSEVPASCQVVETTPETSNMNLQNNKTLGDDPGQLSVAAGSEKTRDSAPDTSLRIEVSEDEFDNMKTSVL